MLLTTLMNGDFTSRFANDVVIITGVGATFGVVGRWVFVGLRHQIRKEIQQPNGGNSVRDFIIRTDSNMTILHGQMDAMMEAQTDLGNWQSNHEGYHRGFVNGVENNEAAQERKRESRLLR